jgi:sarcosine oxidase
LMRRFPAFRVPSDSVAVVQPEGGFLEAEPSVEVMVSLAQAKGAEIRWDTTVGAIEPLASGVRITTDRGVVEAGAAIVALGSWVKALLPELAVPIRITRQVMAWLEPRDPVPLAGGRMPVFLLESRHGIHYGFPLRSRAIKVAKHHHRDQIVDPEAYDRTVSAEDEMLIRVALAEHLPAANGNLVKAKTCLYTMTPDGDFIIDRLPGAPQIVVASPCSGHGFKFAPAIGDILADLVTTGATTQDISRFALARFGRS